MAGVKFSKPPKVVPEPSPFKFLYGTYPPAPRPVKPVDIKPKAPSTRDYAKDVVGPPR